MPVWSEFILIWVGLHIYSSQSEPRKTLNALIVRHTSTQSSHNTESNKRRSGCEMIQKKRSRRTHRKHWKRRRFPAFQIPAACHWRMDGSVFALAARSFWMTGGSSGRAVSVFGQILRGLRATLRPSGRCSWSRAEVTRKKRSVYLRLSHRSAAIKSSGRTTRLGLSVCVCYSK